MENILDRVEFLNQHKFNEKGQYILYWMYHSQREDLNYALEFAIFLSNKHKKPLVVYFPITDFYFHSNKRYYFFMLEGVLKTKNKIEDRGIKFLLELTNKPFYEVVIEKSRDAAVLVLEKAYLKYHRKIRQEIARRVGCCVYSVEDNVVVPIKVVSTRLEPYARTIRNKLYSKMPKYLRIPPKLDLKIKSVSMDFGFNEEHPKEVEELIKRLNIDKSVEEVTKHFRGGEEEASNKLEIFIKERLHKYRTLRSNPGYNYQSDLSPYLHFGQISPVRVVLEILKFYDRRDENVEAFFNELIVWRELARNFCYYNPLYNEFEGIPTWAKQTLEEHLNDRREYVYSLKDLEEANTHDSYWNAAQKELLKTGKMHNYMRMYWCKKLIEWTTHPKEAFNIACYLNDKYSLDGRDPNGYLGISWCFGSCDHPWPERKIFGKVRYMSKEGLSRKFDMDKYLQRIDRL
ncbi:deoxyribodipyrimidine photo-lyase [Thermodesulfobacterium hveragerdense]|uniref:deoxyribodipyrimidine photo-lyase n=1 Tax=Thermodesulfobacterium hveragerdense TaxID=53424 RepID=UPI00048ACC0E